MTIREQKEEAYYIAYLTENEMELLYDALNAYEMEFVGPKDRKEAERLAIVTDALKEACSSGKYTIATSQRKNRKRKPSEQEINGIGL